MLIGLRILCFYDWYKFWLKYKVCNCLKEFNFDFFVYYKIRLMYLRQDLVICYNKQNILGCDFDFIEFGGG